MKTKLKFKRKVLASAVLAGLAGAAGSLGVMAPAEAVFINPDGTGQALIYPYWTVNNSTVFGAEGSTDTLLSVVNTTSKVKVLKVRFLEYKNSIEVLDFNLFLSPNDVWTAAISLDTTTNVGSIKTLDTSCTAPTIPAGGQDFRSSLITDAAGATPDRLREGHLEIIEMGELCDTGSCPLGTSEFPGFTPATFATHASQNCGALNAAYTSGAWVSNFFNNVTPPGGGVMGGISLLNVAQGTDNAYAATALDAFSVTVLHTSPSTTIPTLASTNPPTSIVFAQTSGAIAPTAITSVWASPVDAVSALFMRQSVLNEFVLDSATKSGTDWVVTFPTKRAYVNGATPVPPFTTTFVASGACEPVSALLFDREENTTSTPTDFSPAPVTGNSLCFEANAITFNNSNLLGSGGVLNLPTSFENGWMDLSFASAGHAMTSVNGDTFSGLPAIGFAVQSFSNGNVNGFSSNFSGVFDHRGRRVVSSGI